MTTAIARLVETLRGWPSRPESASSELPEDRPGPIEQSDEDVAVVRSVARRLTYSETARTDDLELLATALRSDHRDVRKAGMEAVATAPAAVVSHVSDAVPVFADALGTADLVVRIAAARGLARIAAVEPDAVVPVADRLAPQLAAYNIWISGHVGTALAHAARRAPATVVPLVTEYVDFDRRDSSARATTRNALDVLHHAAMVAPASVEPVIPTLVESLSRPGPTTSPVLRTLAAVAETYPALLAPGIPALERHGREQGESASLAIETLARVATADPYAGRSAVATLVGHLTKRDATDVDLVADAVAGVLARYPSEHRTVLSVLGAADSAGRVRAARRLATTETDIAESVAETALAGSSLSVFLP